MRLLRFSAAPLAALMALMAFSPASAQHGAEAHGNEMRLYSPADTPWKDGPASLPPGARFAVLDGDPGQEGPFVMRLWFPDGFRILPHWHPKTERITVISGTFHIGMGDAFDTTSTRAMPAGTFGYWSAGMRHFAWTKGETVLQLHGIGPWSITYVNPADDPRNARK
jgi:hypothetical protein